MKISELLNEVTIDNEHGWGQVPMNLNVEYRGLRVLMKPSVFLKLAAELTGEPSQKVRDHIANQGSIGAPFLEILIPKNWPLKQEAWSNVDASTQSIDRPARVVGHEGRNRMLAVQQLEGDDPIEVHLFFRDEVRSRHLTPEIVSELNHRLIPERHKHPVYGPFFEVF